jgi:subtilase family serine protease
MHGTLKLFAPFAAALAMAGCNANGSSMPTTFGQSTPGARAIPQWKAENLARRACPETPPGDVQCELLILNKSTQGKVYGWGAPDIEAAYNLPSSSKGSGQIVVIVDAYDNPNVASDLAVYREHYGLPKAKFYKYNQDGQQSHYPKGNVSWGAEIDLDVDMVSASCPNCTIDLIEADDYNGRSIATAEREAAKLGAHVVSNSFGCVRCLGPRNVLKKAFEMPGVTHVVSAGDRGYLTDVPMEFEGVVSVGGTVLSKSGSTYSEVVWPDTGGGCATHFAKPSWQHDPSCLGRTTNDVAAVAWNVAYYDSYGGGGWRISGGTSDAAPIIAGVFGLAGNAGKQEGGKIFWTLTEKQRQENLHAITSGTNNCPPHLRGSYLCVAGTEEFGIYSGPTGWGTPNGIGAF